MSGFSFSKRIKIAPGVRLNLNKRSTSLTLGGTGLRYTVGTRRRPSASAVQQQIARTTHANERTAKAYERELAEGAVLVRTAQVTSQNQHIQARVDELTNLLPSCLSQVTGPIFESMKDHSVYPEFHAPEPHVSSEPLPLEESFMPRPLGWPLTLFPPLRHQYEQRRDTARTVYRNALAQYDQRNKEALQAFDASFEEYLAKKRAHDEATQVKNAQVDSMEEAYRTREPKAVEQYVLAVLTSAVYPDGVHTTCTLAYSAESRAITVNLDLPPSTVVPRDDHVKFIKSRQQMSFIARSIPERRKIYERLVSSLVILTIQKVLTATSLDIVDTVIVVGGENGIDPTTGNAARIHIVSITTTRTSFSTLNLAQVDPVQCLKHLGGQLSHTAPPFR